MIPVIGSYRASVIINGTENESNIEVHFRVVADALDRNFFFIRESANIDISVLKDEHTMNVRKARS